MWVYFNSTLANPAINACMLYYNTATNQINLLNDNATMWLPATLGTASTLQNSQCSLNVAASTATPSGNTLTLNLAMTFKPSYAGAKNTYLHAVDVSGSNSGWQHLGAWTVAFTSGTAVRGLGIAEFGVGNQPDFRAAIFRYRRGVEPDTGVGVFQRHISQSRHQCLHAVL